MASTKISAISTTDTLSSLDGNDYLVVGNGTTNSNSKLLANSIITTLVDAGYGTTPQYLINDISSSNAVTQKGLRSADGKLTVTETTSGDNKNIILTVIESALNTSNITNGASYLTTVNLAANVGSTILPVANGGTGVATLTDKAVLITQDSGTDTVAAVAMSTNGQILMGGTSGPAVGTLTAGTNVTIGNADGAITINAAFAAAASNLDMANNNIDLGTGFLSFDGNSAGIKLPAAGKVYVGNSTPISASSLNVESGLTFVGGKAQTIEVADAGSATTFTIKGSDTTSTNAAGGNLTLQGGAGNGSVIGGHLKLVGGAATQANYGGVIQMSTYTGTSETLAVQIDNTTQDVHAVAGNLVIDTATKGLVVTTTTVTQTSGTPAHTDGVTINSTAGIITLAAVALAATTNAEFTVTNSTVGTGSIILLTLQDENTTNNVQLSATTHTIANGSFKISIANPHSGGASSATASKIHYLVIN